MEPIDIIGNTIHMELIKSLLSGECNKSDAIKLLKLYITVITIKLINTIMTVALLRIFMLLFLFSAISFARATGRAKEVIFNSIEYVGITRLIIDTPSTPIILV